jgi:hypothetical protein
MKKLGLSFFCCIAMLVSSSATWANEAECQKLKNQLEVIYAAKGFCFGDKDAKEKFNKDCYTSKPKFDEKQVKKLDEIKKRQKELNCK